MSTPMDAITDRAKSLAEQREQLLAISRELRQGIEALKAEHWPELRAAIDAATAAWKALQADIQAHPDLFTRPRTVVAHGLKFGLEKGKGTVEIADPDKTVKLIKKHFPDQVELLIDVKETPSKDAIAKLPADQVKRLGCELKGTGDRVVIRPVEDETDKLVRGLVKALAGEGDDE